MSPPPHTLSIPYFSCLKPVGRFAQYTLSGAAAGALFTGVGATLLHVAAPDTFHRPLAVASGAVGGAGTHAFYGLLAAFDGVPGMSRRLVAISRSLPIAALTSGVLGGAILGLCGVKKGLPSSEALVISGALGGSLLGLAGLVGTVSAKLMCTQRPGWTRLATGDLEAGEHLLAHHAPPRRHWWQRHAAPPEARHPAPAHARHEAVAPADA